ncbi:MAG TPA: glycosyltransferase, partial [Thermoanaerobaculia bacterium]|nr:glycosyltransferase [Thermoanaerobaculia bacterium]
PVERLGGDAERAIESVLNQEAPFPFELIVITAGPLEPGDDRIRNIVESNRNPATRRNRAASVATGEILAFIDDDARADRRWLATAVAFFDRYPDVLAIGGPDPAPDDSTIAELVSDTLLATRWIGSGVAAHENRRGIFDVGSPSDVALVNLFVRRSVFSGFSEKIGYIGEDTALIEDLLERGRVVYHDGVRVVHRRRAFPGAYLRQRWRYRMKTGELFVEGRRVNEAKIVAFLTVGTISILLVPVVAIPYIALTLILGIRATRLPRSKWASIPVAFAAHHLTYYFAILWGMLRALIRR